MLKTEGFQGQQTIIIPEFILGELRKDPLGKQLYLTDIGFYPNAQYHERIRPQGCNQYILIYCTQGRGWFTINGKTTQVAANQYFILPKGIAHSYGSNHKKPWSIYWLHFSGLQANHFKDIAGHIRDLNTEGVVRTDDRIDLFKEIVQNLEMGYSRENLNYANICLWHFLASFKYISQFRQIRTIREKDLVEASIFFMRENISHKLTLEELANHAGLSPSHFSMVFRQKTGRAPMDYLIHLRIQKACQLLDATHQRIKEVANQVGYEDPYYFSRIFKKVMGLSPTLYSQQPKG